MQIGSVVGRCVRPISAEPWKLLAWSLYGKKFSTFLGSLRNKSIRKDKIREYNLKKKIIKNNLNKKKIDTEDEHNLKRKNEKAITSHKTNLKTSYPQKYLNQEPTKASRNYLKLPMCPARNKYNNKKFASVKNCQFSGTYPYQSL